VTEPTTTSERTMLARPRSLAGDAGLEPIAGSILLAGSALLVARIVFHGTGDPLQVAALALGLLLTLFGLIAFAEALRDRGERLLPRFGSAAFAIGTTSWIIADALWQDSGHYVFELERIYTVLACVTIGLFGWSIFRSEMLSTWIGWFAIVWGVAAAVLYVTRIFPPPLAPNVATVVFGLALRPAARQR
jgi:hypothetical protein